MDKQKVLYLNTQFTKDMPLPTADGKIDSIYIEGMANTTQVDRDSDVIPMSVWEQGIKNYLKNPIILAHHDAEEPIGRMEDYKIKAEGLWVKARISAAAEETFALIKDGVLTAFSVGFIIKDAIYDSLTDLFIIKELELLEISVVSIPCNQDSTFSLSKAFDSAAEYSSFKSQFAKSESAAKEQDVPAARVPDKTQKEWNMDPKELELLLAKAATDAATKTAEAIATKQAAQKEADEKAAAAKAAEEAALEKKVATIVGASTTGAEKLLADVEKRLADQATEHKNALEGLHASIKEKAEELSAIQASKMTFEDKKAAEAVSYKERETAYMLSKIMGKGIDQTKYGKDIVTKAGAHVPSATWELEISYNMENEIRRRLVVAPLLRQLAMQTNVMKIPVNPESGFATWMANTAFGTTASTGAAQTHQLKDITLSAFKVATLEYVAYEEEEDALLIILPIIRDAMVRRVARAVDKAFLLGAGSGSDPVQGLCTYDATSAVTLTNTGTVTTAHLRSLRKDLGVWGLEPSELAFVVNTEVYYDLLEDTLFQTMDKVGPAATILTGQIGSIGNTPVLVSDALHAKTSGTSSTTTNYGAICVAPGNFIAGNQRGLRFDTQDLVETQRKVLVASLRTGLCQMSTVNGVGASVLRWT